MSGEKYIGLDVHQATISVAVVDSQGQVDHGIHSGTKASTILEFLAGVRGTLSVTFEEGTWAAWLYPICSSHTWPNCWCAIRARWQCSNRATPRSQVWEQKASVSREQRSCRRDARPANTELDPGLEHVVPRLCTN